MVLQKKNDLVIIGGAGHVGLPLSIALANENKNVLIIDTSKENVEKINNNILPFDEENAKDKFNKVISNGNLKATCDIKQAQTSDCIIFIIGTPVDEHLNPRINMITDAINNYLPWFQKNSTLILRSTIYPGVSQKIQNILSKKNISVAFCPERIVEGKAMEELYTLPQIISSFSENGLKKSKEIFSLLTDDIVIMKPIEAELAKLFSNVWRYIKFATANQFYMIANDYNLDYYKIFYGMTHNYKRNKDLASPGFAAGPCLFKDAMQLGAFNNNGYPMIHTAMLINEGLPNYIISKLKSKYDLSDKTIGILGMGFKKDSGDIRESLSYKLKKILLYLSANVLTSDDYVTSDNNLVSQKDLIKKSDIIIIATPHSEYKNLKIPKNKIVADVWNVLGNGGLI